MSALTIQILRAKARAAKVKPSELTDEDRARLLGLVNNEVADIYEAVSNNPHMKLKDFDIKELKALAKKLKPRKGQ